MFTFFLDCVEIGLVGFVLTVVFATIGDAMAYLMIRSCEPAAHDYRKDS